RSHRYGQLDSRRSDAGGTNSEDQFRLLAAAGGLHQPDDVGNREQRDRALRRGGSSQRADFVRPRHVYVQLSRGTLSAPGGVPKVLWANDECLRGGGKERTSC